MRWWIVALAVGCAEDRVILGEEQIVPGAVAFGTCAGFTLPLGPGQQIRLEGTTQGRFDAADLDIVLEEDGVETPIGDADGSGRCEGGGWAPGEFALDFSGTAGVRALDVRAHGDLECIKC